MAFRLYPTDIVSESFSSLRVFNDRTTSYADTLQKFSGLRAPSQKEFNKIFAALDQGYLDGAFSQANFSAKNYNIYVYVYNGEVGLAAAHNSSTNAINAGAPKNSIWIGFDTYDLNVKGKLLAAYASHEVLHSSPNIDRQASSWASSFSRSEVAGMAKALGVDEATMRSVLVKALEHKIIGELTEDAYSILSEKASFQYILSSLDEVKSSLAPKERAAAAAKLASQLDKLLAPDECFPGNTLIEISPGFSKPISDICIGDVVLSFDPLADLGRGSLIPRRVVRLHRSITTEWVKLTWEDAGQQKELISTLGHHFLDQFGQFRKIGEMIEDEHATVVLASGQIVEAKAERIVYSSVTAHMFANAVVQEAVVGTSALQADELNGWATYNLEVEGLHTYVAGGLRVHNDSGVFGAVGNLFSTGLDRYLTNGFWDSVGDGISNFLHDVGSAINGFLPAMGQAINDILSGEAFRDEDGRPGGDANDGHGDVSTYLNGTGFNTERFYGGGDFIGQKYQPGGDYDKDGTLSSKDLAARNADLYEKFAKTAETAQEREYYARRAEDYREQANGGGGSSSGSSSKPILLDLNGNGIEITEFDRSTIFMDGGEGLLHRTAWAGAGDGVLFYDVGNDGKITEEREYVFTEWNPTAAGDLEALRSVWDTNGDGKLTAADAEFAKFKVLVTNADGSTTAMTLAALGITEINLTADATNIVLPDGSVITGQTTFTRSNGSTGTVANTTLIREADGYRVVEVTSTDVVGNRVVVSTGYGADGSVAFTVKSVTNPTGTLVTNSYDDNGDGVVDRIQVITKVTNANGSKTETLVNKAGADAVTAITVDRTVTTVSADGKVVTIERDSEGGGWFDQREVRTTSADSSRTTVISDLAQSGAVIRSSSETVSVNGLTRSEGGGRGRQRHGGRDGDTCDHGGREQQPDRNHVGDEWQRLIAGERDRDGECRRPGTDSGVRSGRRWGHRPDRRDGDHGDGGRAGWTRPAM